jgi:hypothetical protein
MIDFFSIRQRVPLLTYLDALGVKLRRVGKRHVGKCPLHGERNGESFTVEDDRWKCWGSCSAQGDVVDFHMRRLGLLNLKDAVQSLLGGELPVIDDEIKRSPREHPKPALPYQLTKTDLRRMAAARLTLYENPELVFTVLGQRPEWTLEAVRNTAVEGDLGLEYDCRWYPFDGPAVLFGFSHGIKARWLYNGERIVRWLCGSPAGECWRQSLLRPDHRRIYLTEGETDTLTGISLRLEEDDDVPSLVVGRACAHGYPDPAPFKGKEVVIIADPDPAGTESAQKLLRLFGPIASKAIAITPEQPSETDSSE